MPAFRYAGIPSDIVDAARQSMRSPQYGHPAHREVASGYGPCRHCLRTFQVGQEERLLFTYQPILEPGGLPAPGPVFVHAGPCARYEREVFPPDLAALPLVVEGYRTGGTLVVQERAGDAPPEVVLARVFETPGVDYAHLRNAEAGCFMARVERSVAQSRC